MRRASLLLMGAVMILSMARPASAKPGEIESGYVTSSLAISGPGLTGAVALDQAATQTYSDVSNMFNPGSRMHVRPSSVALGPRYDALLTLACVTPSGAYATVSIRQELYPYATFNGHPLVWTNTPRDQVACQGAVVSGWNAARRGLFQTLVEAGLPPTVPVQAPVSGSVASSQSTTQSVLARVRGGRGAPDLVAPHRAVGTPSEGTRPELIPLGSSDRLTASACTVGACTSGEWDWGSGWAAPAAARGGRAACRSR